MAPWRPSRGGAAAMAAAMAATALSAAAPGSVIERGAGTNTRLCCMVCIWPGCPCPSEQPTTPAGRAIGTAGGFRAKGKGCPGTERGRESVCYTFPGMICPSLHNLSLNAWRFWQPHNPQASGVVKCRAMSGCCVANSLVACPGTSLPGN